MVSHELDYQYVASDLEKCGLIKSCYTNWRRYAYTITERGKAYLKSYDQGELFISEASDSDDKQRRRQTMVIRIFADVNVKFKDRVVAHAKQLRLSMKDLIIKALEVEIGDYQFTGSR